MEFLFSQLKQKDVISLNDGKNLGKVCDITVSYPENNFIGITASGCRGFKFSKQEIFIPVCRIVRVGKDAILVKSEEEKCPPPEKPCPPNNCPPPCPPKRPQNNCPPPCPPNNCPPDRRSYDEYE